MQPIRDLLAWWIGQIFDDGLSYKARYIKHGDQTGTDTYSCGIISCNAIAHELFGDELWTAKNKMRLRIAAFNEIVKRHNEAVSILSSV